MPPWSPQFEVNEWFYGLRTDWRRLLRSSKTPADATRALIRANAASIEEDPGRAIFWLALAHYQLLDGCLQPRVRRYALAVIRRGPEHILWLHLGVSMRRRQADFDRLEREITNADP